MAEQLSALKNWVKQRPVAAAGILVLVTLPLAAAGLPDIPALALLLLIGVFVVTRRRDKRAAPAPGDATQPATAGADVTSQPPDSGLHPEGEPSAHAPNLVAEAKPSRLSAGFFRRPVLRLYPNKIEFDDPGLFSNSTRRVKPEQVTQVDVSSGLLRSKLHIYASGQGQIEVSGLPKTDAKRMRDTLESLTS